MMWIYVVLSVVILITIFYLFRKDKDILSDAAPVINLKDVEVTIQKQDDDIIENYNLNTDVNLRVDINWKNGIGWSEKIQVVTVELYFGDMLSAQSIITRGGEIMPDKFFNQFQEAGVSFATTSFEVTDGDTIHGTFLDSVKLNENIIGKPMYLRILVQDETTNQFEMFEESTDTGGRRMLRTNGFNEQIIITEEQINRVVEITGLEKIVFPINVSRLTINAEFQAVTYLEVRAGGRDDIVFYLKPSGDSKEMLSEGNKFLYYKDDMSNYHEITLKFSAPVVMTSKDRVVISLIRKGKELYLAGGQFMLEDVFYSVDLGNVAFSPDSQIRIFKSNKMEDFLNKKNYDVINKLLWDIDNAYIRINQRPYFWEVDQKDVSMNYQFILTQRGDGNLVIKHKDGKVLWTMRDNNIITDENSRFKWNNGTAEMRNIVTNKSVGILYSTSSSDEIPNIFLALDNKGHFTVRNDKDPDNVIHTIFSPTTQSINEQLTNNQDYINSLNQFANMGY